MMDDISPELLNKLQEFFDGLLESDQSIASLYQMIKEGTATYKESNDFAIQIGEILAKTFGENISSSVLPDGKMYYNIAEKTVVPMLKNNYSIISDYCAQTQKILNSSANIGIKPITPALNQSRIEGIVNRIASADKYDDISWMLKEPVVNFCQSIVDDSVKANSEFQYKSGLKPKIVRTIAGHCCEWCANLAGTYSYPDVPHDVYRRHNNCRCTVVYDPGDGRKSKQDVWSKQWGDSRDERISKYENRNVEIQKQEEIKKSNRIYREQSVNKIVEQTGMSEKEASIYFNKNKYNIEKYGPEYVMKIDGYSSDAIGINENRKTDGLNSALNKKGKFRTTADPMRDRTGFGEVSNPQEIKEFRQEIDDCNATLIERDTEYLAYSPGIKCGVPGTVYVSKGASYSAWCHEMQHLRDDRDGGWYGYRIIEDEDKRYSMEERAYQVEIDLAKKYGYYDVVKKLKINLYEEKKRIYEK